MSKKKLKVYFDQCMPRYFAAVIWSRSRTYASCPFVRLFNWKTKRHMYRKTRSGLNVLQCRREQPTLKELG